MNRQGFLQSLALATFTVYLRLRPQAAYSYTFLPAPERVAEVTHDDCYRQIDGGDNRFSYKGAQLTAEEVLAKLPRRSQRIVHGDFA